MTVELAVELSGPPGAPALVLLSSLGCSSAVWDGPTGTLAEQFRVIRIDLRGHGSSPASPPSIALTIDDLGTDVLAVLDRLDIIQAHLAGLSIGGMVGQWLAIHHPLRVGRLAVLGSSAHPGGPDNWHLRASTVRRAGMSAIADAVSARWITPELAARDPKLAAALRAILTGADPESYAQCCEILATLDLRADLGRIAAPTLVVVGDRDQALPVEHSQQIVAGVAGSRLVIVTDAAHVAPVEQPGIIAQLLLEHFGGGATVSAGLRTRRAVLGDQHVDRAVAATTEFSAPFQNFITRYAWGEIWSRPGLSRRDRSIATLAALVALGSEHEIAMHVRGARRNGLSWDEIGETLLHTAVYAGVPRANRAFAIANQLYAEQLAATES